MSDLNDIVEQIDLLAPIPAIATQILAKSEDPDSSMSEIADLNPSRMRLLGSAWIKSSSLF
jgi:hypothetical protein